MEKKDKRLHIRINGELHQMAKSKAASENRTLSNYVLNLIIKDLEKKDIKFYIQSVLYVGKNYPNSDYFNKEAKNLTLDIKYLDLVNYGINRTNRNLEEKIKAKSQLP